MQTKQSRSHQNTKAQINPEKNLRALEQTECNIGEINVRRITNQKAANPKYNNQNRNHQSSAHFYDIKRQVSNDFSTHFTQNLRENKAHTLVRSHSRNHTVNDGTHNSSVEKLNKHFGRITMHCLRKKREIFEKDSHSLESQYNYILKKIDKIQKEKWTEQQKEKRQHSIQSKHRKEYSFLKNLKMSNDSLINQRKQQLKEQVMSHRAIKIQSILKNKEVKAITGVQQRMKEQEYHQELYYMQVSKLQLNKSRCERQKVSKLRRQKKFKAQLENRKTIAKNSFKNKWIEEYQKQQEAKDAYLNKKQQLQKKIQEAIDIYREIESQ